MQCQAFSPKLLNRTSAPLTALLLASTALVGFTSARAQELPTGGSVASGGVTISNPSAAQLNIKQSTNSAIVNWQSFSIGSGATVNIDQPTSTSTMLNRVTGGTKSTIAGQLNANGQVFLVNPNGIAISKTGKVSAAGFVGSSLDISDDDFKAGKLDFQGKGASAAVSNEGAISIGRGGYAALIGGSVDNAGTISVPLGKVGLGSGEKATLDLSGDGFLQVSVPTQAGGSNALVSNSGTISADGGTVELKAAAVRDAARQAVNMSGVIEARTVSGQSGAIVLGGDQGDVEISGKLDASAASSGTGGKITVTGRKLKLKGATVDASGRDGGGTVKIGGDKQGSGTLQRAAATEVDAATTINASATGNGNGGTVIVWSDEVTGFQGTILARGGDSGGDGGFSEVSSHDVLDFDGNVDLSARFGDTGYLLLDPYNLTIATTGSPTVSGSGSNFTPTQNTSVLRVSTLVSALANANVVVTTGTSGSQAGDITVANAVTWSSGNSLTLSAYRNIAVNASLTSSGGGAINLRADSSGTGTGTVSFASSAIKASTSGVVSIYYNPASNPAGSGINTTSYTSSSDYSGNIAGGATLNAAMLVNTLNDLRNINNNQDGNYALGRSIDASGTTFTSAPVGTLSGSFDGLGNTISNLTITSGDNAIGLFGTIGAGATVRNLKLANVAVTGTANAYFAGGLAGSNQGSVNGVTVSGTVKITGDSYRYAGGLVGYNDGAISGAISTASVSAGYYSHAGGLAGGLTGSITSSSASGTVTVGSQGNGGGLVGEANQGSSITSSFATGTVTGGSPSQVGGLAGLLNGGSITASYSSSVVNAGNGSSAGGLVGATRNGASINMSYATGAVTVGNGYLGGLVGATLSAGDTITNSYATGKLTGLYVGGLVGSNYGSIASSYFDIDTTGASAGVGYSQTTTGGTGLHTSDFMTASNFTGWTFGTTAGGPGWVIVDVDSSLNNAGGAAGGTRPMLLSEYSTTITNAHQLQLMALNLNGNYTLGNNIDASTTAGGQGVWGTGGFVPIGSAIATSSDIPTNANLPMGTSNERAFTGTFDGKGYSVSNLYINRPTTDFVGLIGFATAATIQNVTLTGGSVTGRDHVGALLGGDRGFDSNYNFIATYLTNLSASTAVSGRDFVGGLAGSIEAGWVTTVSASGTVSGRDYVGGLGGYMSSNSGFVQNDSSVSAIAASATGAVSGRNNVGGLFGYFYSGFYGTSFATGNVTATGDNVGGLIGQGMGGVGSNATDNLYATGSVTGNNYVGGLMGFANSFTLTRSYATGAVTGNTAVGGLVGSNDSGSLIDLSFATGVVRGVDQVGGLAGRNLSVIGATNGSGGTYATGAVYGTSNVGGLVGYNGFVNMGSYSLNGRIQSSYSIGAVNGTTNVGGLVGYNATDPSNTYPPTIKNSYWDTETAGASLGGVGGGVTTGVNAGATGKTTAQLMAALQTGFTSSTWGLVANTSLPYFKWLYASTPQVVTGTAYSDRGTTPLAGVATNILVNGTIAPASAVGSTGANGYYYFLLPNGTISSGGSQVLVTSSGPSAGATFQQNATGSLNGLSIYGGYLKQQGAASTLSALNAARATAVGANAAASSLISGLANMEIDPSGSTFSIDQAISVPGTLVFSSTGTVNQTASIGANSLLLLGSGGNYALNNAGNAIGTVAASTGTVSLADGSDLTVGTVAGASGVTATGAVTLQTAGKLTIASAAKVTAGANSNAVIAAGGAFVNNRGSDAISVSGTGRWLVYSSSPGVDTFGGLDSANTAVWNATYSSLAPGSVGATGNRYIFAYQPTLTFTTTDSSKTYGDTALLGSAYTVSGYQAAVAGAYLGDTAGSVFSGAPTVSSAGAAATAGVAGGPYAINVDISGLTAKNGYAFSSANLGQLAVAARAITVTADAKSRIYGDANPELTYQVTSGNLVNDDSLAGDLATSATATSDAGSYGITQGTLANINYAITYTGADLSVTQRAITVTADAKSRVYGDANPALTYQVTSGNLVNDDSLTGDLVTSASTASGVGTYGIMQGTLGNSNYAITYAGADLSVTQRAITVTADAKSRIYGDANPALTYQVTSGNLVNDDSLSGALATTATTASNVGSYGITQGTLANANYAITYAGADLSVTQRAITVAADAKSRIYGDANPALTYQVTSGNLVNDDSLTGALATSATTASGVGTYGIMQGTLGNSNYAITYAGADLSVTQRAITVTADAKSRIYGDANPALTYQVTSGNLVGSDVLSGVLATSATTASGVGTYGITQGTLANANYAITYAGADLAVTQRAITVTADAKSRIYGDANPALTYQVTSGNLVGSDVLSGALATSATTASGVGTYGIMQGTLANSNYAITYAGADLSVTQRAITVTADAKNRIYGDANPALTYQLTSGNLVNDDSLTGALATSAITASAVGTYGITQGTLANSNYAITYAGADLSVTQRAITVTADAKTRIYGDANPALTYQVTSGNLVNDDSLTGDLATSATATSDVGSYGITQGTLGNSNYAITYAGADLTIGKRSVTVTANAGQGKTYGNADPSSYGYTTSSLGSGADLVGAIDRAAGEDAGAYAIGRGTLTDADNANYDITFVGDNFVIGKRSVTVTAAAGQGKIYGNADPSSLSYSYSDLGTGAALVGTLDRAAGENAGTYAIGQGTLNNANNSNYDITYVGADFTVGKRAITVVADAQSRAQGMPNPSFTYTIGGLGLVGTDTLTGALSTAATPASIPGSYAIEQGSLAASANYEVTYVGADLTVTAPNTVPVTGAASTVAYNAGIRGAGMPLPVRFTGEPADGDSQTLFEDPRFGGFAFCQGVAETAAVCTATSVQ